MRISGDQSVIAGRVGAVGGVTPPSTPTTDETNTGAAATSETPAATVTLSAAAQDISRAKQAVAAAPDTRDALVASIKARVDAGTYNVSGSDIADRMLSGQTVDHSA